MLLLRQLHHWQWYTDGEAQLSANLALLLLVKSPSTKQQMWNMLLIIMDQSRLFNSLVCHLGLLSALMRLYLYPLCFSRWFAQGEPRSKPVCTQFSWRWWAPGHYFDFSSLLGTCRRSWGDFKAADILSLPARRADIVRHVNKMCLLFHRNLIGMPVFLSLLLLLLLLFVCKQ